MSRGLAVAQIEVEQLFERGSGNFSLITAPLRAVGQITLTNNSDQLLGIGTLFLGDSGSKTLDYWYAFAVGDVYYGINSIEDETHATLAEAWTGSNQTIDLIFKYSKATYNGSIVIGFDGASSGENSIALGYATSTGHYSISIIDGSIASGDFSMATNGGEASAAHSIASGRNSVSSGTDAHAHGHGVTSPSANECSVGSFNTTYTPASSTTHNDADRIFTVGIGADANNREDGLVVWKSGLFDVPGNTIRLRTNRTITNSNDTGVVGEICWDSSYVYVCVATNTWKRTLLLTW